MIMFLLHLHWHFPLFAEGNELAGSGNHHRLQPNVTEVGSERGHNNAQVTNLP